MYIHLHLRYFLFVKHCVSNLVAIKTRTYS